MAKTFGPEEQKYYHCLELTQHFVIKGNPLK